ncbi:PREDICTED: uncharacterized protein LOC104820758 [Tarenaya hassleriana]|uniref:uncharacterized protein LOC104820758 n=1 Tax=Tarenaya hassleriana TaxID=28532 RepID=UPI00053C48C7|nr:PREDICTED: uncharacterized protein LOC104820758 [Tarenaya hassleriana]
MANLLLQLSSSSSCSSPLIRNPSHRYCIGRIERLLWRDIVIRDSRECPAAGGGRFRFRSEEGLRGRGGFDPFEFGNREKKRMWWSDCDEVYDDFGFGFDDWEEDDDDGELLPMVFEVFRAFSWMVAPIGISLLLGTDSNAGLMALAVPLVQSILPLVIDKAWSRPSIRPVRRTRGTTFSRSATVGYTRSSNNRQEENLAGINLGGYNSWVVGDADPSSTDSRYGGWDDLDTQKDIKYAPENPSSENGRPKLPYKRKVSRPWRVRDKPLLLRMLIAVFPFLGSWTKLLF